MGTGDGCFEGMSPLPLMFLREKDKVADRSHLRRQRKINSHNVSEHSYMAFTDPCYSIARQGKSLLSIGSIDSYTM